MPAWGVRALTLVNHLAHEPVWLAVALLAAPWHPAWALAVWLTPIVEQRAKWEANRGRPRDPHEPGLPSGDVMLATVVSVPWLGWPALTWVALVMWARLVRQAHWPLDVVAGLALGLVLAGSSR